jgi:hypothetical protein
VCALPWDGATDTPPLLADEAIPDQLIVRTERIEDRLLQALPLKSKAGADRSCQVR